MLMRVLAMLVAAAVLLGGERPAEADSLWDATLIFDPWADSPRPDVMGSRWAPPATEIIDPWEHADQAKAPRDEVEIVDPWQTRRPRIPTLSFPPCP